MTPHLVISYEKMQEAKHDGKENVSPPSVSFPSFSVPASFLTRDSFL